jgi:hypothetical protein
MKDEVTKALRRKIGPGAPAARDHSENSGRQCHDSA